jgi:hypothetical protein
LKIESEEMAPERATFTAVIARLDRATQYSGLAVIHANGGVYWFPAFAGMTNVCAEMTRREPLTTARRVSRAARHLSLNR